MNVGRSERRLAPMSTRVELAQNLDHAALSELTVLAEQAFPGQPFSMADEVSRPWTRLWVLHAEGLSPAAFLVGWHVADELHILNVATSPKARRQGFGAMLLAHAVDYCRAHHVRISLLEVRRSNVAAIGLYKKLGFSISGVRRAYYADNDEDAIEMLLLLDPTTGQLLPRADEPV